MVREMKKLCKMTHRFEKRLLGMKICGYANLKDWDELMSTVARSRRFQERESLPMRDWGRKVDCQIFTFPEKTPV